MNVGFPRRILVAATLALMAARAVAQMTDLPCCAVFELRQYTLHPGQRDVLIELFDRQFIEAQEALSMRVYGQFKDADRSERFVWIRGFPNMVARERALAAFYGGPIWKAYGKAAAATMIDSDDVLLLRSAESVNPLTQLESGLRPALGAAPPTSMVICTIYLLNADGRAKFHRFYHAALQPLLYQAGISVTAAFETEHAPNNYAALPVREGIDAFVWLSRAPSASAAAAAAHRLMQLPRWQTVSRELLWYLSAPPQRLRLEPTGRSLLR